MDFTSSTTCNAADEGKVRKTAGYDVLVENGHEYRHSVFTLPKISMLYCFAFRISFMVKDT